MEDEKREAEEAVEESEVKVSDNLADGKVEETAADEQLQD